MNKNRFFNLMTAGILIFGQTNFGWAEPQLLTNQTLLQSVISANEIPESTDTDDAVTPQSVIAGQQTTLSVPTEKHDALGRLVSSTDDQGIKTTYSYGTGSNQFRLAGLHFAIPKGITLPGGNVLAAAKQIQVKISEPMEITADALHSDVVKSAFLDLLAEGENVTGVVWELQPTRLEQNPSNACDSTDPSFECNFRFQGTGRGHYEYSVQKQEDAQGNVSYTAALLESGLAEDHYDSLGRLDNDKDNQGIKTDYFYGTGANRLKLAKLTFSVPAGTLLPGGSSLAAAKQIHIQIPETMEITPDSIHSNILKSAFLDLLSNGEVVTGLIWELQPTRLEQNPSNVCTSTDPSFDCKFRIQGTGRGHYDYTVQTQVDALGNASSSADLIESGLSEDHYDNFGRLDSSIDNQGIETFYSYGSGADKFKLTKLSFRIPKDSVADNIPPALTTVQAVFKNTSITPDVLHSGVIQSMFVDLLEKGEKVTGVIWELQPTELEQNPSAACSSTASLFDCSFRIQGTGKGYYEYLVETETDDLGNGAYSPILIEGGAAEDHYDTLGRLKYDVDNQGIKTTYSYGSGINKFKLVKLTFLIPKGTLLPGGNVLAKQKSVQIKIPGFMQINPDVLHAGVIRSLVLDMIAKGFTDRFPTGEAGALVWNLLPGHLQPNASTTCTSNAASFSCDFRLEAGKNYAEYRVLTNVDSQGHSFYSPTLLQSGRILYKAQFNFLKGSKSFLAGQPEKQFIFEQDAAGNILFLTEINGVLIQAPIPQNSFVIPKPNAKLQLDIRVSISDPGMLKPDLTHTGVVEAALLDLLSKGEKIDGIAWKFLPTRAQHQANSNPLCTSNAPSFQCDFRLEGGLKFFEYRVGANVLSSTSALYSTQQLAGGFIANAPLTSQKFRKDGRIISDLDEVGIKTQYFYNAKTGALVKLVFSFPKGTVLPGGALLTKTQAVSVSLDFLFMPGSPTYSGLVKAMFLDILSGGELIAGKPWTLRPIHTTHKESLASITCASSLPSFGCSFRLEKLGGNQRYFEYKVQANVNAQGKVTYVTNRLVSGEVIFDMRFIRYNFSLPFTPGRGFIIQTDELGRVFFMVERDGILFNGPIQLAPVIKGQPLPWRRQDRNFIVRLANGSTMIFDVNDGSVFPTLFPF